jgi:hypothetical protein
MEKAKTSEKKAQAEPIDKQLKERLMRSNQMRQVQDRLKSLNDPGYNGSNGTYTFGYRDEI